MKNQKASWMSATALLMSVALGNVAAAQKGGQAPCTGCGAIDGTDTGYGDPAQSCPNGAYTVLIDVWKGKCLGSVPDCHGDPCGFVVQHDWSGFPQGTVLTDVIGGATITVDATGAGFLETPVAALECGDAATTKVDISCAETVPSPPQWISATADCTACPYIEMPLPPLLEVQQQQAPSAALEDPHYWDLLPYIIWGPERLDHFVGMHQEWLEIGDAEWLSKRYLNGATTPTPEQMAGASAVARRYSRTIESESRSYSRAYQKRLVEKFQTGDVLASTTTTHGLPRRENDGFSSYAVLADGWGVNIQMSKTRDRLLYEQREQIKALVDARDAEIAKLLIGTPVASR